MTEPHLKSRAQKIAEETTVEGLELLREGFKLTGQTLSEKDLQDFARRKAELEAGRG